MNVVSPLFDASVAGSLAGASLCGGSAMPAPPPAELAVSAAAASPACLIAGNTKWDRFIAALLNPISGPRPPSRA